MITVDRAENFNIATSYFQTNQHYFSIQMKKSNCGIEFGSLFANAEYMLTCNFSLTKLVDM